MEKTFSKRIGDRAAIAERLGSNKNFNKGYILKSAFVDELKGTHKACELAYLAKNPGADINRLETQLEIFSRAAALLCDACNKQFGLGGRAVAVACVAVAKEVAIQKLPNSESAVYDADQLKKDIYDRSFEGRKFNKQQSKSQDKRSQVASQNALEHAKTAEVKEQQQKAIQSKKQELDANLSEAVSAMNTIKIANGRNVDAAKGASNAANLLEQAAAGYNQAYSAVAGKTVEINAAQHDLRGVELSIGEKGGGSSSVPVKEKAQNHTYEARGAEVNNDDMITVTDIHSLCGYSVDVSAFKVEGKAVSIDAKGPVTGGLNESAKAVGSSSDQMGVLSKAPSVADEAQKTGEIGSVLSQESLAETLSINKEAMAAPLNSSLGEHIKDAINVSEIEKSDSPVEEAVKQVQDLEGSIKKQLDDQGQDMDATNTMSVDVDTLNPSCGSDSIKLDGAGVAGRAVSAAVQMGSS